MQSCGTISVCLHSPQHCCLATASPPQRDVWSLCATAIFIGKETLCSLQSRRCNFQMRHRLWQDVNWCHYPRLWYLPNCQITKFVSWVKLGVTCHYRGCCSWRWRKRLKHGLSLFLTDRETKAFVENLVNSVCTSASVWATSAHSSAKRRSRMTADWTLVAACRRLRSNMLPSMR